MAIKAIIESGRDIPDSRVVELAKNEPDELKQPFTIINLLSANIDHRGGGARYHIVGYQDAFIHVLSSGMEIKYGQAGKGDIMFEKNDLGKLIGQVAKTPWNMETLAAEYADKRWRIMEPEIEAEVKAIAARLRVDDNTIKEREAATETVVPKVDPEKELQRAIEMSKKNETLKKEEEPPIEVVEKDSFPGKTELLGELADMNYTKLLNRARATGLCDGKKVDREDLIQLVVTYEASKAKGDLHVE